MAEFSGEIELESKVSEVGDVETVETVEAGEETMGSRDFVGSSSSKGQTIFRSICSENSALLIRAMRSRQQHTLRRFLAIADRSIRTTEMGIVQRF